MAVRCTKKSVQNGEENVKKWVGPRSSADVDELNPSVYSCSCADVPPPRPPTQPTTANPFQSSSTTEMPNTVTSGQGTIITVGVAASIVTLVAVVVYLLWKRRTFSSFRAERENNEFARVLNQFNEICSIANLITRNEFTISGSDLETPLGRGRFGIVYKASLRRESNNFGSRAVAVKKIEWENAEESVVRSFLREIRAFQKVGGGNENIVGFFGACCDKDGLFLVTELCDGSLQDHILRIMRPQILHRREPRPAIEMGYDDYFHVNVPDERIQLEKNVNPQLQPEEFNQLVVWCEQVATGMDFLSMNGIVHSDLALRNILLKNGVAKICDLGLSLGIFGHSILTGDIPLSTVVPEYIIEDADTQPTTQVDIWAFGFVVWQIFTLGDTLYSEVQGISDAYSRFMEVSWKIAGGYRHPKPPLATDEVYEIMMECWAEDPQNRPSFEYLRDFFIAARAQRTAEEQSLAPIDYATII